MVMLKRGSNKVRNDMIVEMRSRGRSVRVIALYFGLSDSMVRSILRQRRIAEAYKISTHSDIHDNMLIPDRFTLLTAGMRPSCVNTYIDVVSDYMCGQHTHQSLAAKYRYSKIGIASMISRVQGALHDARAVYAQQTITDNIRHRSTSQYRTA